MKSGLQRRVEMIERMGEEGPDSEEGFNGF
jgi:hypothetical protein